LKIWIILFISYFFSCYKNVNNKKKGINAEIEKKLYHLYLIYFIHCALCLEYIYHDQFFLLEEKHGVNVHFVLKDDQPLYIINNILQIKIINILLPYLLMNSSSPLRLASIKSSSNIPSLLRRNAGICRSHAFPGNDGTIIYK